MNFYDKNFNNERKLFKPTFEIAQGPMDTQLKSLNAMKKTSVLTQNQLNTYRKIIEMLKKQPLTFVLSDVGIGLLNKDCYAYVIFSF